MAGVCQHLPQRGGANFDVNTFAAQASSTVNAQTATTYEIGTRGRRPDFTWDIALYRAEIRNELQCLRTHRGVSAL